MLDKGKISIDVFRAKTFGKVLEKSELQNQDLTAPIA